MGINHKYIKELTYNKGFTLVELSIVIVVIGLIVAGVVGGQALVKQAQLRSAVNDIQKYKVAYNTFFLEYNSIPGDFTRATSYWPGLTSNGSGNGFITCTDSDPEETALAWQHMQLAKLIPGNYDGDLPGCNTAAMYEADIDLPGTSLPQSLIHSGYSNSGDGLGIYGSEDINYFTLSGNRTGGSSRHLSGILTPKDAHGIDKKIDDGIANQGRVYGLKRRLMWATANICLVDAYGPTISWAEEPVGSDYDFSDTEPNCLLAFVLDK